MNIIETQNAPGAVGPYSQAIVANGFVFTSGQIPIDPATGRIEAACIEVQTAQVIKNLAAILEAAGSGLDKVVKTTCFLSDIGHFSRFNEIYGQYFTQKPARSCVEAAKLPKDALLEIEAVAAIGS